MPIGRYRINQATRVLIFDGDRDVAHTLPKNTIVSVDGADDRSKLVNISWDDNKAMMFLQDLKSRGERVREASRNRL